jgi:hypothetical protein
MIQSKGRSPSFPGRSPASRRSPALLQPPRDRQSIETQLTTHGVGLGRGQHALVSAPAQHEDDVYAIVGEGLEQRLQFDDFAAQPDAHGVPARRLRSDDAAPTSTRWAGLTENLPIGARRARIRQLGIGRCDHVRAPFEGLAPVHGRQPTTSPQALRIVNQTSSFPASGVMAPARASGAGRACRPVWYAGSLDRFERTRPRTQSHPAQRAECLTSTGVDDGQPEPR